MRLNSSKTNNCVVKGYLSFNSKRNYGFVIDLVLLFFKVKLFSWVDCIVNSLTANDALPNYPSTAKAVNAVT